MRKLTGSGVEQFDFDTHPQTTIGPFETKMAASNE